MPHRLDGTQKTWHKVTLDFLSAEQFSEEPKTFRDYRLDVTFRNSSTGETITVPGFFAGDGDAADSNATSGNVWRVNFNPPDDGTWTFEAHFRNGNDIAAKTYAAAPNAGKGIDFDGETGSFKVSETDKSGEDFRAKGMILQDEGTHYLQHQGDGDYFIRGGPGIPENFLANKDIDGTAKGRHDFNGHQKDFDKGDPTWDGGKGSEIIGAVNYLADQGQNAIYVMTNTAGGDGQDVWPWAGDFSDKKKHDSGITKGEIDEYSVFDVSKLAQWEIIFDHMDEKGIYKNVLLQETENDQMLNGGTDAEGPLSVERMIYMREMVARFGHNNGLQWNIGEENTNTDAERLAMADYLESLDAYGHLVVAHTFPGDIDKVFKPLLGDESFDGTSFQTPAQKVREKTIEYRDASEKAGDPWVLAWDEDSSSNGIVALNQNDPDSKNEKILREALWGHLTANGSGTNWYLKDNNTHSLDQNYDAFRAHESIWDWTAAATDFFNTKIPFWNMTNDDDRTADKDDYVMADDGDNFVIYLPYGEAGDVRIDLRDQAGERYDAFWYNPREGGGLISDGKVDGGAIQQVGGAPRDGGKDWVLFLQNDGDGTGGPAPTPTPDPDPKPAPVVVDGDPIFEMQNGRIVMQAEDGVFVYKNNAANKNWDLTTEFKGDKGDGVMLWTGDDFFRGSNAGQPQTAPMTYQFTVDEPGDYYISLRAIRPVTGEPSDRNNDFYVQFEDGAWKKVFFSGAREKFQWGTTYDVNHNKSPSKVEITQKMIDENDGVFTLGIAGRSREAGLDEIHIKKGSFSRDSDAPTSPVLDGPADPPPPPPPPPPPVDEGPTDPPPPPPPSADASISLRLIDAKTDKVITSLTDGKSIDVDDLNLGNLSIEAVVNGAKAAKVKLDLNGEVITTEEIVPYALFGDKSGNFAGGRIDTGSNEIKATAYDSAGRVIAKTSVDFEFEEDAAPPPPPPPPVDEGPADPPPPPPPAPVPDDSDFTLTLVEADTGRVLGEITDGGTVALNGADARDLTVVATYDRPGEKAISLSLNDGKVRKELVEPYTLFGDIDADMDGGRIPLGKNEIEVKALNGKNKVIDKDTFDFRLVKELEAPEPPAAGDGGGNSGGMRLFLADAKTNALLADITDGGVIDGALLAGRSLTAVAVAEKPKDVGSVRFEVDEGPSRLENIEPYALFGDSTNGDLWDGTGVFEDGAAEFQITAYAKDNGKGGVVDELDVELVFGSASEATIDFL